MRLIGEISCSGFKPKLIIIVEQFGLAIIPLCFKISSGFTSGTTRGTSGSIRNALELSITIAPRLAASGANVLEIEPPANNAISIFSKEEMKMVNETQKILHDDTIQVVPTTVRVPVYRSHSESVLVETAEPVSVEAFRAACEKFPGLQVKDNPAEQIYPMPLYTSNQNDCEIGRIRKDLYNDKGMNFWIVGDQIRKGAALNALQIAEYLVEKQAF